MPAQAGIQYLLDGALIYHQKNLDSGFRRNDGREVDFESTGSEPVGLEPRIVQSKLAIRPDLMVKDRNGNGLGATDD